MLCHQFWETRLLKKEVEEEQEHEMSGEQFRWEKISSVENVPNCFDTAI